MISVTCLITSLYLFGIPIAFDQDRLATSPPVSRSALPEKDEVNAVLLWRTYLKVAGECVRLKVVVNSNSEASGRTVPRAPRYRKDTAMIWKIPAFGLVLWLVQYTFHLNV